MTLPDHADYHIIGAGIHGISTAWKLAERPKKRGERPKERGEEGEGRSSLLTRPVSPRAHPVSNSPYPWS